MIYSSIIHFFLWLTASYLHTPLPSPALDSPRREGNEPSETTQITYAQLLGRVQRFANVLKSLGVKKGDTVAIYQPMILDLVVAMLACARIGAPHSIVVRALHSATVALRNHFGIVFSSR